MEFTKIDELKFDEKGLIPAVVVDAATKKVLTVASSSTSATIISPSLAMLLFSTSFCS